MKLLALFFIPIALQLGSCAGMRNTDDKSDTAFASLDASPRTAAPLDADPPNAARQSAVPLTVAPQTLIARDFVSALRQLAVVPPDSTTVNMQDADRKDVFVQAMQSALQGAGYGVRWVENEGSESLLQYRRVEERAAASARRDTYELAVGSIEMRRVYFTDSSQRVRPVTPLYIRGADGGGIVLDDAIFESQKNSSEPLQETSAKAVPMSPTLELRNSAGLNSAGFNSAGLKMPSDPSPLDPVVRSSSTGNDLSKPLLSLPREQNMFELGISNFQQALAGSKIVAKQVLTFANDSMRLGNANKRLLEKLVSNYDPETDVFSVIGCSMGGTQVKGGNAALALGRAGRVVEALRFAGVDDNRILDEGCWAGDSGLNNLPARGVVLSLNRLG